jgi:hypothetical protein
VRQRGQSDIHYRHIQLNHHVAQRDDKCTCEEWYTRLMDCFRALLRKHGIPGSKGGFEPE